MLKKETIIEIVNLCDIFAKGVLEKDITKESYSKNFKEPHLTPFEKKHKLSPNQVIQKELKIFLDTELLGIDEKLKIKNFGFWGNNIYSYVWTCVYYDFGNKDLAASYSPQLYILINKMGIKFGFCYGNQIKNDDDLVDNVRNDKVELNIKQLNENNISFFNSSLHEITARPEVLFGTEERIILNAKEDLFHHWSNKSLLVKEYSINEIPINISDEIQNTLLVLKEFYLNILPINMTSNGVPQVGFDYKLFQESVKRAGLFFSDQLIVRFISSLLTKPFVILTGLSGSGKTKLAQAFAQWICYKEIEGVRNEQYCIVPVGADWTNREPLLGYPNALDKGEYVRPENGLLDLIIRASKNEKEPHFLILDEMNLSHVERYFADFLSTMESGDDIPLHKIPEKEMKATPVLPQSVKLPKNLFIIGTVNIDETTYMFSPKVLDRANTIEFRLTSKDLEDFIKSKTQLNMDLLKGNGEEMGESFVKTALQETDNNLTKVENDLKNFFIELKKAGAEFGYRTAGEIGRLMFMLEQLGEKGDALLDIAIMQKLLPKLHGSRNKLTKILPVIAGFCLIEGREKIRENYLDKFVKNEINESDISKDRNVKFKISFEKICRMYKNAVENGFASYAEA